MLQHFWDNLFSAEPHNIFEAAIFAKVWVPLMFLTMAMAGFVLIMRRSRWGYALSFVGALGIAMVQLFLN